MLNKLAVIVALAVLLYGGWWYSYHKHDWHGSKEMCVWAVSHRLTGVCAIDR